MNQYRVDKDEVGVTLHLSDGSTLRGSVFLSPCSAHRSGRQTVVELLAETGAALAFASPEGRFLLVGTAAIAAVALTDTASVAEGFWSRVPVTVCFVGGHVLRGSLLLAEGAGNRLSDIVRATEPWLLLEAPDALVWIAKAHLLTVESAGA